MSDEQRNVGHGHVFPRPDGVRMRCGGPGMCAECSRDAARKAQGVHSMTAITDTLAECARAYAEDVRLLPPHPLWSAIEAYENARARS